MFKLLLLAALAIIGFISYQRIGQLPPAQKRQAYIWILLLGLVGITVILVATGRLHWVGAAIAAAIPVLKWLFGFLPSVFPFLMSWRKRREHSTDTPPQQPVSTSSMDNHEALQLLGLDSNPSREDIIEAHRKLMQKLHPDRGGNDYLAAKLNQAKEVLLEHTSE